MKRALLFLLLLFPMSMWASDTLSVYVLRLDSQIHAKSARTLDKALKEAQACNARFFVLHLNTYGGALDAADKMRTELLDAPMPTVAFIDHQAASAGALISIACDSIYMSDASSIGSASVVDQSGKMMPEKYQSFMRSMMRATAESTGRDPLLAERMVDGDTIVNLTTSEAIAAGYCQAQASSIQEVVSYLGVDASLSQDPTVVDSYKETFLDKIIGFFLLPIVQGILLMGIVGGVFLELKTPGIGLPLGLALVCALCYFSPLFLEGLAQYWELLIIVIGLIFLVLELFVTPGFGVLGVLGILGIFTGLTLVMVDNWVFHFKGPMNWNALLRPIAVVSVSGFLSVLSILLLLNQLFPTRWFSKIALRMNLDVEEGFVGVDTFREVQIGQKVKTMTPLHPVGKVEVNGKWEDARAAYGFIPKDALVKIVRIEGGVLLVELTD